MSSIKERLLKFSEELDDWEKIKTSIPGVSIVKLPSKGGGVRLALEVVPTDEEGMPLKRKGIYITSIDQWKSLQEIFTNPKGLELITNIEELKGEKTKKPSEGKDEEPILEL